MTRVERILFGAIVLVGLVICAWLAVLQFGADKFDAGYAEAIAAGQQRYNFEAELHRQIEADLRTQLAAKDAAAFKREQEHADSLAAAQRRITAGVDRLRCPTTAVPATATTIDRPAAGGSAANGEGLDIVPAVAVEILGDGADVAGLVRRYQRVLDRFDACQALNAVP